MSIWYIKQTESIEELCKSPKPKWLEKLVFLYKKTFKIITIKEVGNKTIAILPCKMFDKCDDKHWEKLASKLACRLYDKPNQNLVLSEPLYQNKAFVNCLNTSQCNILDGRWLFSYIIDEVLQYISEKSQKPLEIMEIAIMVNDNSEKNLKTILRIAQKVKMLNIVTNHIEAFRKIEGYLYEKMGILVRITNNTKKSLLKTNVVVNMDFPEELVNKYTLPKKGILVNIGEAVNIKTKRFNGINANFYEIDLPEEDKKFFEENHLLQAFSSTILYESLLYKKISCDSIRKQIEEKKSKVKNLVGVSGIICEKEYKDSQ